MADGTHFDLESKVIQVCFVFTSCVIGQENSLHSINQSDAKLKPVTRFPALLAVWLS